MDALYAFMRLTDDLSDEPGDRALQLATLQNWRERFNSAMQGSYSHPIHPALHWTIQQYGIDPQHLNAVIDGVVTDLDPKPFETFEDLAPYCHQVASAVGLACLPVWGCTDPRALVPARAAGLAFQLTNILRDLGEDLARGRVYLPQQEIRRFDAQPPRWHERDARFRALMRFQVERVEDYYRTAWDLNLFLPVQGRAIYHVMYRTYRGLLSAIVRNDYDVLTRRIRLPKWSKAAIFASAWPIRWGWI